jgi:hypothetical protein
MAESTVRTPRDPRVSPAGARPDAPPARVRSRAPSWTCRAPMGQRGACLMTFGPAGPVGPAR